MHGLERSEIAAMRAAFRMCGFMVAEADAALRYVWVENPHPDFQNREVIGKRDDELVAPADAEGIMALKREVLDRGEPIKRVLGFPLSDGYRFYCISAFPLLGPAGAIDGLLSVSFDTLPVLHGILPICSHCRAIRDEQGNWQRLERYLQSRTSARFSHGICPECEQKHYR